MSAHRTPIGHRYVVPGIGYVRVKVGNGHHLANNQGMAYEHRLVAEEKLGRPLAETEVVHHLNGDRSDNRPENIAVLLNGEHQSLHIKGCKYRLATPTGYAHVDVVLGEMLVRGWSQKQLAAEMGVTTVSVSNMLKEKPCCGKLRRWLFKAFNGHIPLAKLFRVVAEQLDPASGAGHPQTGSRDTCPARLPRR